MEEFDDFLSSLLLPNAGGVLQEGQKGNLAETKDETTQNLSSATDNVQDINETSEIVSNDGGPDRTDAPFIPTTVPAPEATLPVVSATSGESGQAGEEHDISAKEKKEQEEQRTQDPATLSDTNKTVDASKQAMKNTNDSEAMKQTRRGLPLCFKNTLDEDFLQNRKKFGLQICSVICFDVLKLGDRVFHRNDSTSAVFPTMKRIAISKQNIKDMYQLEAEKRVYYRKKLNRILKREKLNVKKPKHKANADKKSSSNKPHYRGPDQGVVHEQSCHTTYHRKTSYETSHKTRAVEKFSAGGTRILPFEKQYNESNKQIKRPKLEEPKISRVLVGKHGLQKDSVKQLQRPLPGSFRIPKRTGAETHHWQGQQHQPIVSTPLAFAPRESFRFDRFRQNTQSKPRWVQDNLKTQKWNFQQPGDFDQESSAGASCAEESIKTPPPPISEVEFGPLVEGVSKLLETNSLELNLPPKDVSSDLLAHKCAWWFRTIEKDPVSFEVACPELHDRIYQPSIHSGDDLSFLGNVSNNGDEDDCQVNEITSTENLDPAVTDEFCGAALISVGSQYRVSLEDESFRHIFQLQPGTNYEKENFQVLCTICEERVLGKRRLGAHIRSPKHVENLKKLSLQIMSTVGKRETPVTMLAEEKRNHSKSPKERDDHKFKEKPTHGGKSSVDKRKSGRRSRSRSPRHRESAHHQPPKHDRSSRRVRSRSRDPVEEFLARTNRPRRSRSRSPYKSRRRSKSRSPKLFPKSGANEIFHEKLRLTSLGKWDTDMEMRYKMMEEEEDTLQRKFATRRKDLDETPESHPSYATEWQDFWQKKYQEVQDLGKDPDDYDYVPEWKEYWSAQGKMLLKMEFNSEIESVRLKYGMDITSLRKIGRPEQMHDFMSVVVEQAPPRLSVVQPPVQIQEDFTARSMSISDNGADEPVRDKCPVTVDDIKSTWETLTGQRISQKLSSDSDSSKTTSSKFEFDGFDLVQVLQLMSGLEDQLGVLALKVNEFHRKAEALELTKRRQSYSLLQNRDFIALLLRCKSRFAGLVTADNLPQKKLKTLSLCVHLLEMILETPNCRVLVSLCIARSIDKQFGDGESEDVAKKSSELVSSAERRAIARLLASNFTNLGKHACTNPELEQMVYSIIHSISKEGFPEVQRLAETAQAHVATQNAPDTQYDSVSRVVGTALPPLPTINVRAVSPPPTKTGTSFIGGNLFSR